MAVKTTFVPDPDEPCEGTPAFHSQPDNEWRIEYHGDESNEWTVWRWDYPTDEWVPVAISVAEGYPLPDTVIRSKGFSDLEVAQEWVRSRIVISHAMSAVSGVIDEARNALDECDLLSAGAAASDTEIGEALREWGRASKRLVALANAASVDGDLGGRKCERCGEPITDGMFRCEECAERGYREWREAVLRKG